MNNVQQMFGGPGTIFQGSPITPAQTFNVAQAMGISGSSGMLINGLMQTILPNIFGSNAGQFGQFLPQTNLYDQFRQRAAYDMQQQVIARGAALDQKTYEQMFRGFANLAGTPFGMRERMASQTMAGDLASIMPMLSQIAPDLVDRMHGSRGSAAVMAQRMALGSRYMADPVSGASGMSANTVKAITDQVFNNLFGEGRDISEMRGISAGQAGAMFDEMARRGIVGSAPRSLRQIAQDQMNRRVGGPQGPEALDRTVKELIDAPDFNDRVQQFEANRITDKIKAMSGAVAAMKDIFGENGRSDAPMAELFNALQAMTQNNLSSMNPADVERMVRNASNMAKMTGMSLDTMMANIGMAGQASDKYGVNRVFATNIATGSAAFAQAYASNMGGTQGFNLMDKEKALALSRETQAAGINSPAANAYAALIRMSDSGMIDPVKHKQVADYVEQVKAGTARHMTPQQISSMLSANGLSTGDFNMLRGQTSTNQAIMFNTPGIGKMTTLGQVDEARDMIHAGFSNFISNRFKLPNADLASINQIINDSLIGMDSDQAGQYSVGNVDFLVKKIKEKHPNLPEAELRQALSLGAGAFNELAEGKGNDILALVNTNNRRQAERNMDIVNSDSIKQRAFAKLNRGTPMQRFGDMLQGAKENITFKEAMLKVLGANSDLDIEMAKGAGLEDIFNDSNLLKDRPAIKDAEKIERYLTGKDPNGKADVEAIAKIYGIDIAQLEALKDKDGKLASGDVLHKLELARNGRMATLANQSVAGFNMLGIGKAKTDFDMGTVAALRAASLHGTASQTGSQALSMSESLQADVGMLSMMSKEKSDYLVGALSDIGRFSQSMDAGTTAAGVAAAGATAGTAAIRNQMANLTGERSKIQGDLDSLAKSAGVDLKDLRKNLEATPEDRQDLDRLGITKELADAKQEWEAAKDSGDENKKKAAIEKYSRARAKVVEHAQKRGYAPESVLGNFNSKLTAGQQTAARSLLQKQGLLDRRTLDLFNQATKLADGSGGKFTANDVMGGESGKASEMLKDITGNLASELEDATRSGMPVKSEDEIKKDQEKADKIKAMLGDPETNLNKILKQLDPSRGITDKDMAKLKGAGAGVRANMAKTAFALDELSKQGLDKTKIQDLIAGKGMDTASDEVKNLIKQIDPNISEHMKTGHFDIDKIIKSQERKAESSTEAKPQTVRLADGSQFTGTFELTTGDAVLTVTSR